mgnify:FL=1
MQMCSDLVLDVGGSANIGKPIFTIGKPYFSTIGIIRLILKAKTNIRSE